MDRPPSRKHAKAPESVAAQRFPALIVSSHAGGHWFESSSLHHEKTLETLVLRAFRSLPVCLSLFTCARSVRCHMGQCALLRWSGGGHHAAELSCGRLRRCPVIRPATDLRMYDLFLRYRDGGKCRDKNSKQRRRKNLPAISASYDPSCVYGSVYILYFPGR